MTAPWPVPACARPKTASARRKTPAPPPARDERVEREAAARRKAEEEARHKTEEDARRKAEDAARKLAPK